MIYATTTAEERLTPPAHEAKYTPCHFVQKTILGKSCRTISVRYAVRRSSSRHLFASQSNFCIAASNYCKNMRLRRSFFSPTQKDFVYIPSQHTSATLTPHTSIDVATNLCIPLQYLKNSFEGKRHTTKPLHSIAVLGELEERDTQQNLIVPLQHQGNSFEGTRHTSQTLEKSINTTEDRSHTCTVHQNNVVSARIHRRFNEVTRLIEELRYIRQHCVRDPTHQVLDVRRERCALCRTFLFTDSHLDRSTSTRQAKHVVCEAD